jgi:menaquinone-dependent protoporphyrinogen oxidase
MSKRVLVGYATGRGSTIGVAETIGATLGERGFDVDVKPLSACSSIEDYDAIVLGSAVNGGVWLPEAVSYAERHAEELGRVPVAAFCVHGMNAGDDEKPTRKRLAYLDKVRVVLQPVDEGFFLGEVGSMNGIAKFAFTAFGGAGEGDMRDWDKIRSWARQVQL